MERWIFSRAVSKPQKRALEGSLLFHIEVQRINEVSVLSGRIAAGGFLQPAGKFHIAPLRVGTATLRFGKLNNQHDFASRCPHLIANLLGRSLRSRVLGPYLLTYEVDVLMEATFLRLQRLKKAIFLSFHLLADEIYVLMKSAFLRFQRLKEPAFLRPQPLLDAAFLRLHLLADELKLLSKPGQRGFNALKLRGNHVLKQLADAAERIA